MRDLLALVPKTAQPMVSPPVRTVFIQPDQAAARASLRKAAKTLERRQAKKTYLLASAGRCGNRLRVLANEARSADEGIRGFTILAGASGGLGGGSHMAVHLVPDRDGDEVMAAVEATAELRA